MKSMLGTWLEDKRGQMGLTKGQMSEKIGIVVGQYSAYVSGKSIPRQGTLDKIASALKISTDELRQMMDTPPAVEAAPAQEIEAPAEAECVLDIQSQLAAAQSKVIEGKLDLVIAMLKDIGNRLPR